MNKYLVTYHAPAETMNDKSKMTQENMNKYMELWKIWTEKCGSALVDLGTPLGFGQNVVNTGQEASNRNTCGFSILQAENMDSAKLLLEGHPHLAWDQTCDIQIYQQMQMPG
ncbi:hypothetical protein HOG98_08760 [bacterium]|jgi:hypothetical protein|nr:hypothetical protein [bacterium]